MALKFFENSEKNFDGRHAIWKLLITFEVTSIAPKFLTSSSELVEKLRMSINIIVYLSQDGKNKAIQNFKFFENFQIQFSHTSDHFSKMTVNIKIVVDLMLYTWHLQNFKNLR